MKRIMFCGLWALLLLNACSKNNEAVEQSLPAAVTPATAASLGGTLSGTAAPMGAIKNLRLVGSGNGKLYEVVPNALNGSFAFSDVLPGDYMMYFTFAEHFVASPIQVKILAKTTTDLGIIRAKEIDYALSCHVNGQFQGWILKAYRGINSNLLQITNYTAGSSTPDSYVTAVKYQLSITLQDFKGIGTYICDKTSGNSIRYNGYKSILVSSQDTQKEGSSGVVTITAVDPVARLIQGTFSADLASRSVGSNDAKKLTDGQINVYY